MPDKAMTDKAMPDKDGQTTLYLTPMPAAVDKLAARIAHIRAALGHARLVAQAKR